MKVLSPSAILERLEQRLPLLTGGARNVPERQRTLRATIEWSYGLLAPEEQQLFARIAVFAGGCTLEAAEEVCDADLDTLQALVDKSLVRQADERFWMLETIREFATERLRERSDLEDLRQRHAAHYLALAETAEAELRGAAQRAWLERLELDHDNLRAALAWARESVDTELGLRLAAPLWRFWRMRNHLAEGRRVLEELLEHDENAAPAVRARAFVGASRLALDQGDSRRSVTLGEEALSAARASGEARPIAAATENLGVATFVLTDSAGGAALALLEESVEQFQALGDPAATADALNNLGSLLMDSGKSTRAREVLEEALALQRQAGNVSGTEFTLHSLAYVALHDGDLEFARGLLEESLVLSRDLGHLSGVGWCLDGLAHVAAGCGDDRRALVLWAAGESTRAEAGVEMQRSEAGIHEEAVSRAQMSLGEAADRAWAEGAALAPDDAVAYALTDAPRRRVSRA